MKSTTAGPSRTAPNSSTTRGEVSRLHVLTSSRLKRLSGIWGHMMNKLKSKLYISARRFTHLTLLAAHVNPVAVSWTQKTSPKEPFWM